MRFSTLFFPNAAPGLGLVCGLGIAFLFSDRQLKPSPTLLNSITPIDKIDCTSPNPDQNGEAGKD
jgi:hypothetical protein